MSAVVAGLLLMMGASMPESSHSFAYSVFERSGIEAGILNLIQDKDEISSSDRLNALLADFPVKGGFSLIG